MLKKELLPALSKPFPKIAVFRALDLGDLLCSVPAIRALKQALPKAQIYLIGLPWAKEFANRFKKYLSGFVEFPGYPGLPEQKVDLDKLLSFLKSTQRKQFDLIIQMQGDGTITNSVVQLLGGKLTAGFYPPKDFCPNNDLYFPYQENIHEVVLQTNLLEFLGFSVQSLNLEFPFQANDYRDFAKLNLGRIKKPVVCLHPGAKNPEKRWAVKNFAKLASELASLDYQVIITGTKEEMELAQYIEKAAPKSTINLVGKTSLGSLALLLKKADLLITNDTGVSHLATALKTKSLVIFQKTDPTRWAPTNTNLHKTVLAEEALFPKVLDLAKHAIGGKNYA